MINVLIADDHFIVRSGLISLINSELDMHVVAEACDGDEAVRLYQHHQPDVALLDMRMPHKSGELTIEAIRREFPEAKILIFSAFSGDEDIHRALQSGALGYVLKSSAAEDLIPALRSVFQGKKWLPSEVSFKLSQRKAYESLTHRELEVLKLIAEGLSNKEIAQRLSISEYTTKDHIKHIFGKLQVVARTEAVTMAIQRGLLKL